MAEKVITVFGGSGFLGRHIIRRLAAAGHRIRVATRHVFDTYILMPDGDVGQIASFRADIRSEASAREVIDNSDAVVNLVGILKPSGRQTFAAIHADGAAHVARAAAKAGAARLVHISALGADPNSPSAYARSKAEGEVLVREAFPAATILRPSIVFGPEDQFFNRFARLISMSPGVFPLFGGGHTRFQPVYVGDVAEAVARAIDGDAATGKTVELGGPVIYTLKDVLTLTMRTIGRKRALMPVPFWMLEAGAALTGWIPGAPLTVDQVRLLRADNVVTADAAAAGVSTLADLGIRPTAAEAVIPSYLWRFRPRGQYAEPGVV